MLGEVNYFHPNKLHLINDERYQRIFADYKVSEFDLGAYHAILETKSGDPNTLEITSVPRVQIYDQHSWDFQNKNNGFHGTSVEIIHDPKIQDNYPWGDNPEPEITDSEAELRAELERMRVERDQLKEQLKEPKKKK